MAKKRGSDRTIRVKRSLPADTRGGYSGELEIEVATWILRPHVAKDFVRVDVFTAIHATIEFVEHFGEGAQSAFAAKVPANSANETPQLTLEIESNSFSGAT